MGPCRNTDEYRQGTDHRRADRAIAPCNRRDLHSSAVSQSATVDVTAAQRSETFIAVATTTSAMKPSPGRGHPLAGWPDRQARQGEPHPEASRTLGWIRNDWGSMKSHRALKQSREIPRAAFAPGGVKSCKYRPLQWPGTESNR